MIADDERWEGRREEQRNYLLQCKEGNNIVVAGNHAPKQAGSAGANEGAVRVCQAEPVSRWRGDWTRVITVQVERWAYVMGKDHEHGCTDGSVATTRRAMESSGMLGTKCETDIRI